MSGRLAAMIDLTHPVVAAAFAWVRADRPPLPTGAGCETRDVFYARLERLRQAHRNQGPGETADVVNAVVAEVGGNSFDHNLGQRRDVPGVHLADTLSEASGLVADRGQGV